MNQEIKTLRDLRTGDQILFRYDFNPKVPLTYLSLSIRTICQYPFNHCALVVHNRSRIMLYESAGGKIGPIPIEEKFSYKLVNEIIILRANFSYDRDLLGYNADQYSGISSYDYTGILHQLIYRVSGKKIWIGPDEDAAYSKQYCSEYNARVWNDTVANTYQEPHKIGPHELHTYQFRVAYMGAATSL